MRPRSFLDMLSKRAPSIVVVTLCASLLGAWMSVPDWLPKSLAVLVGSLALLLFASRRRHQFNAEEEGNSERRGWIAYELAGKGTPAGYYVLGFFGIVTIVLTGVQSPCAMLAWAGFALGLVWGIVNAEYPADEDWEP